MLPVREMKSAADVLANYKRVQGVFFGSRQTTPTQVPPTAKITADLATVALETPDNVASSEAEMSHAVAPSDEASEEVERDILDPYAWTPNVPTAFNAKRRAKLIVEAVASKHQVSAADILGPKRDAKIKDARFEAVAEVYKAMPHWSLTALGHFFGRHHTSILHVVKTMKVWERTRAW